MFGLPNTMKGCLIQVYGTECSLWLTPLSLALIFIAFT